MHLMRRLELAVLFVAVLLSVAGSAPLTRSGDTPYPGWSLALAVCGVLLGSAFAVSFGLRVARGGRERRPRAYNDVSGVRAQLLRDVRRRLAEEAQQRELSLQMALPPRWSLSGPVHRSLTMTDDGPWLRSSNEPPSADRLAEAWRRVPSRHLLVLGRPGAGKTTCVILLALELLEGISPDEPVPVLLSGSDWAQNENANQFVARRLAADYPDLSDYGDPIEVAHLLVASGHVLPIVDGLDESVDPALILMKLDEWSAFIATCRTSEYEQAIVRRGVPPRMAVVELAPPSLEDLAAYLLYGGVPSSRQKWVAFLDALRADRNGPLARVMSSPLYLPIIRSAYTEDGNDPQELLDVRRFPSSAALEDHLLERFVTTALTRSNTDPHDTARWLSSLAARSNGDGPDITLFGLSRAAPAALYGVIAAVLAAAAGAAVAASSRWLAVLLGVIVVLSGIATAFSRAPFRKTALRSRPVWRNLSAGAVLGVGFVAIDLATIDASVVEVVLTTGCLLALMVMARFSYGTAVVLPSAGSAQRLREADRRYAALLSASCAALGALAGWTAAGEYAAAVTAAVGAFIGVSGTASYRLLVSRLWLAVRQEAPLQLFPFLEDACDRGLLRRHSSSYQFRHAALRRFLLAWPRSAYALEANDTRGAVDGPFPVLEAVSLSPVVRRLGRRRRRLPTDLPVPRPGEALVFQRGETYALAPASGVPLRSAMAVDATAVLVVSLRNTIRAARITLPSATPGRLIVIRAEFSCRVTDPQLVLESGFWDVTPVLTHYLLSDETTKLLSNRYAESDGPEPAQWIMARLLARAELSPVGAPGLTIRLVDLAVGFEAGPWRPSSKVSRTAYPQVDGPRRPNPADEALAGMATERISASADDQQAGEDGAGRRDAGRFLRRIAGADEAVVDALPYTRVRFTSAGGVLLTSAVLAAATFVVVGRVVGLGWAALVLAPFFGVLKLSLDRLSFMAGMRAQRRVFHVVLRMALSVPYAIVVAQAILLSTYATLIDAHLGDRASFLERSGALAELTDMYPLIRLSGLLFALLYIAFDLLPLALGLMHQPYDEIVVAKERAQVRAARMRLAVSSAAADRPPNASVEAPRSHRTAVAFGGSIGIDSPALSRNDQGTWEITGTGPQTLRLTMITGDESAPGALTRRLLVKGGRAAQKVTVEVEIDAPSLQVSPERMAFTLPTSGGARADEITVRAPRPGRYDIRISVYSAGRIIQAVPLTVAAIEPSASHAR